MIFSVALTIAGYVWHHERPDLVSDAVSTAGQVLPQLVLLWVVSAAVFGRGRATYHRILGAIVMYLGIGMIFVSLDIMLVHFVPGANLPTDPFELRHVLTYFSFNALTTSSFVDIVPVHPIARSLANLEAICGQLFPAILLARVVGLHSSTRQMSSRGGGKNLNFSGPRQPGPVEQRAGEQPVDTANVAELASRCRLAGGLPAHLLKLAGSR